MIKILRKAKNSNRHLTTDELHRRWKVFLLKNVNWRPGADDNDPPYDPAFPTRRYAPSKSEKRTLRAYEKFLNEVTKAHSKLNQTLASVNNGGRFAGATRNVDNFLKDLGKNIAFVSFIQSNVTKGKVKVIPSFLAEIILVGFNLHGERPDKDDGYRHLRDFFRNDGEFYHWAETMYGENADILTKSICGKHENKPLNKWVKHFRALAFENIVLNTDDPTKSNKERALRGRPSEKAAPLSQQQVGAAKRTNEIDKRILHLTKLCKKTRL